jgi:hypothetical protein
MAINIARRKFIAALSGAASCGRSSHGRSRRRNCRPSGTWVQARLRSRANGSRLLVLSSQYITVSRSDIAELAIHRHVERSSQYPLEVERQRVSPRRALQVRHELLDFSDGGRSGGEDVVAKPGRARWPVAADDAANVSFD